MADEQCETVLLQKLEENKDERLTFLRAALIVSREAGKIISNVFKERKTVETKETSADLVTETDKLVEKLIFETLQKEFPNHCFIGEESVSDGAASTLTSEPTWIVDPIDGTCNFVHMNNYVAVSVALVINKQTEVGVVFAPMLNEMYFAVRKEGAYLNGTRLKITHPAQKISSALIATEWGANRDTQKMEVVSQNMMNIVGKHCAHGVRCTGSAALNMCLVASGAIDLYYEWGPHCWDVAAASLMVHEAGGCVTTTKGTEFDMMSRRFISASCRALIDEIVPSLTDIPYKRDDE